MCSLHRLVQAPHQAHLRWCPLAKPFGQVWAHVAPSRTHHWVSAAQAAPVFRRMQVLAMCSWRSCMSAAVLNLSADEI